MGIKIDGAHPELTIGTRSQANIKTPNEKLISL